ncbi:lipopolysaccharide biosynthesis protein [Pseudopedobacter saltans DSM 12145]|uniref:Lipopolysaccharide biosynthesis protein n=1 Tax=Pseudopedobacter saltans (strain ATCC 51119 / DSM 12145 / JCM 21818 / CCUG 39354 / LMG 10337 / NBRC 100064 / NCIMB 13643) TaxID=762903 RepID=F0SBG0_PSESL|nr:LPS biosynthesis protein [Pseudopedobacter saltans]ADY51606.1 lipopolysaccharide biosynthesis protein [Pseudopedobacter saltans DSM 12145]
MEELAIFSRLIKKHKYTLIIIPIFTIIITFFLVRNLPDSYISQAQISTGIVDETQQTTFLTNSDSQKANQVTQEFSNLIEIMKMKKILDQVSYLLIIHDLTAEKPFRELSSTISKLSAGERKTIIETFKTKYAKTEGLNLWDKKQIELYDLLRSMNYDTDELKGKLRVYRQGDSDFINIEFDSESPELSAFVVNNLSQEFINYYTQLVKANQKNATTFLGKLVQEKKEAMDKKIDSLRSYKIRNRVLNLQEQSSQLYAQILVYTDRIQQVKEGIASKSGALNEIDRKFSPKERSYLESTLTKVNQGIIGTKQDLKALHDLYIESGFDPKYQESIDSLKGILSGQINRYTDQYIYNPLVSKQELIQQKLNLDIQLDMSRYSLGLIERQLDYLNEQFDKLVPHEAVVQSMERDVDVTSREYLDILQKFNQSNMEYGLSIKLKLVQTAMPGLAQPSKKMLLVILSGIISFVFCVFVIFVLYYIDNSVKSPKILANKTESEVLGYVNALNNSVIDLKEIWTRSNLNPEETEFRNHIRSIRFELDKEVKDKTIVITSVNRSEGKTLLALNLAFAWNMTNKKVLLIDSNFSHGDITEKIKPAAYLEDYLTGKVGNEVFKGQPLEVLGNYGDDTSLLEIAAENQIKQKIEALKGVFDIIIIETVELTKLNQATEWLLFSSNVIGVFEADRNISEAKKQYTDYLNGLGTQFKGWVLNKLPKEYISKV